MAVVVLWELLRNFFDSSSGHAPCWGVQIQRNVQSVAAAAGHCLAPCDGRSCSLSSLAPTTRSLHCCKLPMSMPQCAVIWQGFCNVWYLGSPYCLLGRAAPHTAAAQHSNEKFDQCPAPRPAYTHPYSQHCPRSRGSEYFCAQIVHNIWSASSRNNILRSKFSCFYFHILTSSSHNIGSIGSP